MTIHEDAGAAFPNLGDGVREILFDLLRTSNGLDSEPTEQTLNDVARLVIYSRNLQRGRFGRGKGCSLATIISDSELASRENKIQAVVLHAEKIGPTTLAEFAKAGQSTIVVERLGSGYAHNYRASDDRIAALRTKIETSPDFSAVHAEVRERFDVTAPADTPPPNQPSGISNAGTESSATVETEPLPKQPKAPSDDDQLKAAYEELAEAGYFDPPNNEVAGKRVMRAIAQRQGQPDFRKQLITAYQEKCVVTDCSVVEVLEAAHIKPFCEEQTYSVPNGLLLRSGIHTLFDKYLMGINPDDFKVFFAESAMRGKYKKLNGKPLRSPIDESLKPSQDLLRERWDEFCKRTGRTL